MVLVHPFCLILLRWLPFVLTAVLDGHPSFHALGMTLFKLTVSAKPQWQNWATVPVPRVGCVPIYVVGMGKWWEVAGVERQGGRLDHMSSTDFLSDGERCSETPRDVSLHAVNGTHATVES